MGRKRTGGVRFRYGAWYVVFKTRSNVQKEVKIDPPSNGDPYDEVYANSVKAQLILAYERGTWDPEAPVADTVQQESNTVTVIEYLRGWIKSKDYESAPEDSELLDRYVARSAIATMHVREIKAKHMIGFIDWLKKHPSQMGGNLAPRTIRNIYDVVRRGFNRAVIDELLTSNPCDPLTKELPPSVDKEPNARDEWIYPREHIVMLLTDPRIPTDRRIAYTLEFLTGCRFSELAALRWKDWDQSAVPMTKLTISRAVKSVSRVEGRTKTNAVKWVPVHAVLEEALQNWLTRGWEGLYGRAPTKEDLIVPTRAMHHRRPSQGNRDLARDCKKLGIPHRKQHSSRHSFITHAQMDGADGVKLQWVTHAPPKTGFNGYTRPIWTGLCSEVAKINLPFDKLGIGWGRLDASANVRIFPGEKQSGREDLKTDISTAYNRILQSFPHPPKDATTNNRQAPDNKLETPSLSGREGESALYDMFDFEILREMTDESN